MVVNANRLACVSILLLLCARTDVFAQCVLAPNTSAVLMCRSRDDFHQAVLAQGISDLGLVSFEEYAPGTVYPTGFFPEGRPARLTSAGTTVGVGQLASDRGGLVSHILRGASGGGLGLNFQAGGWVAALGFNLAAESVPPGSWLLLEPGWNAPGITVPATGGFIGFVGIGGQAIIGSIFMGTVAPTGQPAGGITLIDNIEYPGGPTTSQANPFPPIPCPPDLSLIGFCYTVAAGPQWYDPPATTAFRFTALTGHFTAVNDFPTGFNAPFTVSVGGQPLGAFGPGQSVTFPGGTSSFVIAGISPTVDAGNPLAFPIKLSLDTVGATFVMEPVDESATDDRTAPVTVPLASPAPNGAGWHRTSVTVALASHDEAGGSGVNRIAYTLAGAQSGSSVVAGGSASISIVAEGTTFITYHAIDEAGNEEVSQTLTIRIDTTAPTLNCAAADSTWHAADVSIACAASDPTSGLAAASDPSFFLTTSVPVGVETATAVTGTRSVCDLAGNCGVAGPIGGNKVDKNAPGISINAPAGGTTYVLNEMAPAAYSCSDPGSGVSSCVGPVSTGSQVPTSSVGAFVFVVRANDNVMNSSSASVPYVVSYAVRPLHDPSKPFKNGSTVPLRLQLTDAAGVNASSPAVEVTATSLRMLTSAVDGTPVDAGSANPDSNFRYDPTLGDSGGYIYNLKTAGLATGTYIVEFAVTGDSIPHQVQFQIR